MTTLRHKHGYENIQQWMKKRANDNDDNEEEEEEEDDDDDISDTKSMKVYSYHIKVIFNT